MTEKAEVFLEVFGNSEIRSQTEETLKHVASQLSLSVSDMQETATHPCLDTTLLKVNRSRTAWNTYCSDPPFSMFV